MIVVSSCLAGMKVRYNATDSMDTNIQLLVEAKKAVTVCPELLGGFTIPREPAEIVEGTGMMYWREMPEWWSYRAET